MPSQRCLIRTLVSCAGVVLLAAPASAGANAGLAESALDPVVPSAPRTLYVAPDGSDRHDCATPQTPCASFDRGYKAASPGDIVELAGGTYPGPQWFSHDPTKTSPVDVVVRPAPGARVLIDCDWFNNCLATNGADHLTVRGVRTAMMDPIDGKPRQTGVSLDRGSDDVTFQDVDAGHIFIAAKNASVIGGDYGPTVDRVSKIADDVGENVLIDGATFHHHLYQEDHMECIALYGARGVVIRNSRFDTCWAFAIFGAPDIGEHYRDVLIENNFFSNSGGAEMSAHVKISSHGGDCSNFLVRNNTFIDENVISFCGIEKGVATNIRWIANIFSDWNTGDKCENAGGHVFDYNVIERGHGCGPHDLEVGVGGAGLVDRRGLDLRLRADSPAIDRGSPAESPGTDIDGNPRPHGSAPDAGADEHGSTGGARPSIVLRAPAQDAEYARGSTVEADYSCAAGDGQALESCAATVAAGAALETSALGRQEFIVTATDAEGRTATRTVTYTVADRTAPTATVTAPADAAVFTRDELVEADFACADEAGGSGIESCTGSNAAGAAIDTSTLGEHAFTATATDAAGNTATTTVAYTVVAPPAPDEPDRQATDLVQPGGSAVAPIVRRYGPRDWDRGRRGPRPALEFELPTHAAVVGEQGVTLRIDCRRRCRAAATLRVRGPADDVWVRTRATGAPARGHVLRLTLAPGHRDRLAGLPDLRVAPSATVADRRGRRARIRIPAFTLTP